jgi:hypothetical protein
MHRAGVLVLAGTDAAWYQPYTYAGFWLHDELMLLVRAGLTGGLANCHDQPCPIFGVRKGPRHHCERQARRQWCCLRRIPFWISVTHRK